MSASDSAAETRPAQRPVLALTTGDPCGVGPEIVLKAAARDDVRDAARLLVLGDEKHLRQTARELKLRWPFGGVVTEPPAGNRWSKPQLLELGHVDESLVPGQVSALAGKAAGLGIERAVELALSGEADGVVTAPLQKEALSLAGYSDPGHTEMLARLSGAKHVGMLFWCEQMSVALLTTHMSLKDALRKVRKGLIYRQLKLFDREWERFVGGRPRIAVAGLNPHASEGGRFGQEESRFIVPAIEQARARGMIVDGPISADSVFTRANNGEFDLVLALYHDQGTIPIKLLYGRQSVNVTVGLPFVRTSVDHGTAMEIAGRGIANEDSLVQAIRAAARFVGRTTAGEESAEGE